MVLNPKKLIHTRCNGVWLNILEMCMFFGHQERFQGNMLDNAVGLHPRQRKWVSTYIHPTVMGQLKEKKKHGSFLGSANPSVALAQTYCSIFGDYLHQIQSPVDAGVIPSQDMSRCGTSWGGLVHLKTEENRSWNFRNRPKTVCPISFFMCYSNQPPIWEG